METLHSLLAHPFASRLGWSLAHFVWEGAILAAVLAVILVLLRKRSASARYLACLLVMLLMIAALPLTWCLLTPSTDGGDMLAVLTGPASADNGATALLSHDNPTDTPPRPISPEISPEPIPVASSPGQASQAGLGARFVDLMNAWMPWIVLLWLAGVSILSVRLAAGWLLIQRMRHKYLQPVAEHLDSALQRLARRLAVSRPVRLVQSAIAEVPSTIGWLRPMILLPAGALTGLTTDQIEAVIAHELAHIRRYDYLVNLVQSVVETLLFYHPAVWWLSRRMRIEREHCCDDLAVAACGNAVTYARALSSLESLRAAPRLAAAAGGGSLVQRVRRILGVATPTTNQFARYAAGLMIAAAVLAFTVTVELSSLSAVAGDKPGAENEKSPATQPAIEPENMRNQPHRWRHFAAIVVGESGMTFQGRPTDWESIDELLKDVPDRNLTVLTLATTTELPEQTMREARQKAGQLVQKHGFEYLSFVGVHPLGSKGDKSQYLPPITQRGRWRHFLRIVVDKDGLWFQGRRLLPGDLHDLPEPQWTMLEIAIGVHQGSDEEYSYETVKKQLRRQAEQAGLEGVVDVGMQSRTSKGSPSVFIRDSDQPGYWRHYVTLVASPDEMTFQGNKVTLKQLRDRLAALPDQPNTVFCLAVTSDKVPRNEVRSRIDPILGELDINHFSFIGVHPLGTKGGPSIFTPEPREANPTSQPGQAETKTLVDTLRDDDFEIRKAAAAGRTTSRPAMSRNPMLPLNPSSRPAEEGGIGGPAGTVLTLDGKPAKNATVVLVRPGRSGYAYAARFLNGRVEEARTGAVASTSNDGRFSFSSQDQPFHVVILHDQGFGELTMETAARSPQIKLQPWGRVEGRLQIGNKPGNKEKIILRSEYQDPRNPDLRICYEYTDQSDDDGQFVLGHVAPGSGFVGREVQYTKEKSSTIFFDHAVPVEVSPGQTTKVIIGGSGRPVAGRVVAPGKSLDFDRAYAYGWLNIHRPQIKPPADFVSMTDSQKMAWHASWLASAEGQVWRQAEMIHYFVPVNSDGTFRVQDVPPGTYDLHISVHKLHTGNAWGMGEQIGGAASELTVPAGAGDSTVDVGSLELKSQPRRG